MSGYSEKVKKIFEKNKIGIGSKIRITTKSKTYEGILMPRTEGIKDIIVIKLKNGYNIGIKYKNNFKIEKLEDFEKKHDEKIELKFDEKKPTVYILHTGGTIASKVDYRTGGVEASFGPEDLIEMFPEIKNYANIKSKLIRRMFSEDMRFEHHQLIAKEVANVYKECDGIIVTHGTDTLHYTSASLAFMLGNIGIPVILVGSQRSSDRPSTDAAMNLICAVKFIVKTDYAGVGVCMHATANDDYCYIHHPCKVRKMHTSKRDAFQSINGNPIAKVYFKEDKIEFLRNDHERKDKTKKIDLKDGCEDKVAIVKIYPGFDEKILEFYEKQKYKGLVLEGYGLGQIPINEIDEFTNHNKNNFNILKRMIKKGCIVAATSQTIFGRINLNVYSTGRDMQSIGIIGCEDMHPETAFVKLKWLLGNFKAKEVKELLLKNLRGELS